MKVGDKVKTKYKESGVVKKICRQCVVVRNKKDLVHPGKGVSY